MQGEIMITSKLFHYKRSDLSEKFIGGLFAGIFSGLIMLLFLVLTGWIHGDSPTELISKFSYNAQYFPPLTNVFLHLGVSAIYGGLFGLSHWLMPINWTKRMYSMVSGIVFGIGIYSATVFFLLPGTGSLLLTIPPVEFLLSHLLFGISLGYIMTANNTK